MGWGQGLGKEAKLIQRVVQILLAEDNDADVLPVRKVVDEFVGSYQLLLAKNGYEALLERAGVDSSAPCPDSAVPDLNFARCSGIQILKRLRKTPRCVAAPVIVFTSSDSHQDKAEAVRLGANRYSQKPTDLDGFTPLGKLVKESLPDRAS
jgi:CheY-like chemotaxis protein